MEFEQQAADLFQNKRQIKGSILTLIIGGEMKKVDISTTYMGLKLQNPVIVSSSSLTKSLESLKKCEKAGAGAVVLKSLFEEQFAVDAGDGSTSYPGHPEAMDYLKRGGLMEYAPEKTCAMIEKAKKVVSIPIIASINCQTPNLWPRFARQVQDAGADALELNVYMLPYDLKKNGAAYEEVYIHIFRALKKEITIPISFKLIPEITALPNLVQRLGQEGCAAAVLFNWFLSPDIDIWKMKTRSVKGKARFAESLKWVALLADRVDCDIASSGGVKKAEDFIKQMLAGACAVQVCSLFYQKGLNEIQGLLSGLEDWMKKKNYASIEGFRGELSFKNQELSFKGLGEADAYFRNQYIKVYSE